MKVMIIVMMLMTMTDDAGCELEASQKREAEQGEVLKKYEMFLSKAEHVIEAQRKAFAKETDEWSRAQASVTELNAEVSRQEENIVQATQALSSYSELLASKQSQIDGMSSSLTDKDKEIDAIKAFST